MIKVLVLALPVLVERIRKCVAPLGFKTFCTKDIPSFFELKDSRVYDVWIIEGNRLFLGSKLLNEAIEARGDIPLVVIAGDRIDGLISPTVTASRISICRDNLSNQEISSIIKQELEKKRLRDQSVFLKGEMDVDKGFNAFITKSPLMEEVIDRLKDVALTDATILLEGETGTGKELLAKIIHSTSSRGERPFVAINCGALSDSIIENELFGHEKGAFTGAERRSIGKLEFANGGTLFLDEVETMSIYMQVRLLRVLQEHKIQRLGSNIDTSVNFRLISATNDDLAHLVETGLFRKDLFYRLNVIPVKIPPLRERREDIAALARHFFERARQRGRRGVREIGPRGMQQLLEYDWPGNVRELENLVERTVLTSEDQVIDDFGLVCSICDKDHVFASNSVFSPGITLRACKTSAILVVERQYLTELLTYTSGRIGEAARLAGISPRALYEKMRLHRIKKEDFRQKESQVPIGTFLPISLYEKR